MKGKLVVFAAGLAVMLAAPSAAVAGDTQCVGALPPGLYDNVVVPPGATCTVASSTVRGNVKALENARIDIFASTIQGNVEGDKADVVVVRNSTVREDISIKEGGPAAPPAVGLLCAAGGPLTPCEAVVTRTTVQEGNIQIEKMVGSVAIESTTVTEGDVKLEENTIPPNEFLFITNNPLIAGNLQVFKNTGVGFKIVTRNTVRGNLQCLENTPPFTGGPNTAQKAEGQCF